MYRVEYLRVVTHCGLPFWWIGFNCLSSEESLALLGLGWLAREEKLDSKGIDWRLPGVSHNHHWQHWQLQE